MTRRNRQSSPSPYMIFTGGRWVRKEDGQILCPFDEDSFKPRKAPDMDEVCSMVDAIEAFR